MRTRSLRRISSVWLAECTAESIVGRLCYRLAPVAAPVAQHSANQSHPFGGNGRQRAPQSRGRHGVRVWVAPVQDQGGPQDCQGIVTYRNKRKPKNKGNPWRKGQECFQVVPP